MTDAELKALYAKFTPIDQVVSLLSEAIYKARLPNKVEKFSVDLTTARINQKLSSVGGGEKLFTYDASNPSWFYLKFLSKGTGVWSLRFILVGKDPITLASTEILQGDEVNLEFTELEFTNAAQVGVTNPSIWIEKRYFS